MDFLFHFSQELKEVFVDVRHDVENKEINFNKEMKKSDVTRRFNLLSDG